MLEKLKNRFRRPNSSETDTPPSAPERAEAGATGRPAAPEPRGHDAKALAERKADAAGEKWRREAEARGEKAMEVGGPKGLEPTRYGDWERAGRCIDF